MRKFIIIASICCFGIIFNGSTGAQTAPIKLGIKFSPCLSWMGPETQGYDYNGVSGGASLGLVSDFYFANYYAFSSGFTFSFMNGKLSYADSLLVLGGSLFGELDRTCKFIYLDIPYMIKMKTKPFGRFSFFGQIGFSTGFRLNVKAADVFVPISGGDSYKESTNINDETTLIRQSVLFGLGLEFNLDDNTRIIFGANYSNSLNNILKGHNLASGLNEKAHLNFAELNLGILF